MPLLSFFFFFFYNDTATTEIYTLSLHDALPISVRPVARSSNPSVRFTAFELPVTTTVTNNTYSAGGSTTDRKSTRLNSSHLVISYAVFCLKKKKKHQTY